MTDEHPTFERHENTGTGTYRMELDAHAARIIHWSIRYTDRKHPWEDGKGSDLSRRFKLTLDEANIHEDTIEITLSASEREIIERAVNHFVGDFYQSLEDAKKGWTTL